MIVGADPEGSVFTADDDHPEHPYLVEGIGKDTWPATLDPSVVDEWIRGLRPRLVPHRTAARAGRGDSLGRLGRDDGVGGTPGRQALRPGSPDPLDDPRLRPLLPLEVLRRQLDARVRLPRAAGSRAPGRGRPARGEGGRRARPRRGRLAPQGEPRDRGDAALRDLTDSWSPATTRPRCCPTSSARSTSAACSSGCSRTGTRSTRTSPPRCSRRCAAVEASESIDRVFAELTGGAPAVVVARDGKPVGVVTRSDLLEFVARQR